LGDSKQIKCEYTVVRWAQCYGMERRIKRIGVLEMGKAPSFTKDGEEG
jgi:hypothetical protein